MERIVEWVGDNYILTEDYIYFTHYTFSTSDEGIVQFNRKTKEIKYLEESYCWYLNLVGNSLYYIGAQYDSNNDYTGNPTVCKYNLDSGIREQIDVVGNYTKKLSGLEELYYMDGNLYFRSSYLADENTPISGIYRYNLKTCKTEELLNSSGLSHFGPNLGFGRYVVVSENHIYAISSFKNKTVVSEIKNGVKTFTPYTFSKSRGDTLYVGDRVILVPFFFNEQPLQGYPELNNTVTK